MTKVWTNDLRITENSRDELERCNGLAILKIFPYATGIISPNLVAFQGISPLSGLEYGIFGKDDTRTAAEKDSNER